MFSASCSTVKMSLMHRETSCSTAEWCGVTLTQLASCQQNQCSTCGPKEGQLPPQRKWHTPQLFLSVSSDCHCSCLLLVHSLQSMDVRLQCKGSAAVSCAGGVHLADQGPSPRQSLWRDGGIWTCRSALAGVLQLQHHVLLWPARLWLACQQRSHIKGVLTYSMQLACRGTQLCSN